MKAASGRAVTVKAQATATVDKPSAAQTVTASSGGGGVRVMIIGETLLVLLVFARFALRKAHCAYWVRCKWG